jgi:hypothetical protein
MELFVQLIAVEGAAWSFGIIMVTSFVERAIFFSHVADAEGAELLACRRGVLLARESQVQKLVLEIDSTGVVAKLVKVDLDRSFHGPLVEEIKFLLRGFGEHAVRAVRRSANEAAHLLAKLGCENNACNVWFGDAPASIVNQLVLDSSF